ncbi:MAG: hypothetical protein E7277_04280 [Lachnospiraceae bacterium]|nr:hypothetical protein [Lachnospiraceae bacterium]
MAGIDSAQSATGLAVELGIMASNLDYLMVVVAELGKQHQYAGIGRYYQAEIKNAKGDFQLDNILFLPTVTEAEVKKWAARDDVFLVIDCGNDMEQFFSIQHFCTRSFLLCQLMPWRMDHIQLLMQEQRAEEINKLLVTCGKKRINDLRKKDKMKAWTWQEAEDPFSISTKRLRELYQLTFK